MEISFDSRKESFWLNQVCKIIEQRIESDVPVQKAPFVNGKEGSYYSAVDGVLYKIRFKLLSKYYGAEKAEGFLEGCNDSGFKEDFT